MKALGDTTISQSAFSVNKSGSAENYGNGNKTLTVKFQTEDSVSSEGKSAEKSVNISKINPVVTNVSSMAAISTSFYQKQYEVSQTSGSLRSITQSLIRNLSNSSINCINKKEVVFDERKLLPKTIIANKPIDVSSRVLETI